MGNELSPTFCLLQDVVFWKILVDLLRRPATERWCANWFVDVSDAQWVLSISPPPRSLDCGQSLLELVLFQEPNESRVVIDVIA